MDKKFCDNCGQEIWDKEWLELSNEGKTIISRERIATCSYKCLEEWVNRKRRQVVENINNSTKIGFINLADKYYNAEIGIVDRSDCILEERVFRDPVLVVKPDIWFSRIAEGIKNFIKND